MLLVIIVIVREDENDVGESQGTAMGDLTLETVQVIICVLQPFSADNNDGIILSLLRRKPAITELV